MSNGNWSSAGNEYHTYSVNGVTRAYVTWSSMLSIWDCMVDGRDVGSANTLREAKSAVEQIVNNNDRKNKNAAERIRRDR